MATTAARLQAVIEAHTAQFEKRMDEVDKKLDNLANDGVKKVKKFESKVAEGFTNASKSLRNFSLGMTAGVTLPLAALGRSTFQAAVKLEGMEAMLRTVMGSAQATSKELRNLEKSARLPGMDLQQAIRGSANLQAMGFSAERARFMLEQFSNAIAKSGGGREEFERTVVNLTQVGSAAKLTGDELRELAMTVGPEFRQALQKAFGTMDSQEIAKLGVSGKEALEMVAIEFSKTARANQDTMRNQMDNFEQDMEQMKAQIGKALFPIAQEIMPKILSAVKDLTDWFGKLSPETQELAIKAGLLAIALGPASGVLSAISGILAIGARVIAWYRGLSTATDAATAAQIRYNTSIKTGLGLLGKGAGLIGVGLSLGGTSDYEAANKRRVMGKFETPEGQQLIDIFKSGGVKGLRTHFRKTLYGGGSKIPTDIAGTKIDLKTAQQLAEETAKNIKEFLATRFKGSGIPLFGEMFNTGMDAFNQLKGPIGSGGSRNYGPQFGKAGPDGLAKGGIAPVSFDIGGSDIGAEISELSNVETVADKLAAGYARIATERAKALDPRTEVADWLGLELKEFKSLDETTQKTARAKFELDRWSKALPDLFGMLDGVFGKVNNAFDQANTKQKQWAEDGVRAFEKWFYQLKRTKEEAEAGASTIGELIGGEISIAAENIREELTAMQSLALDVADGFAYAFTSAFRDLDRGFGSFFDNVIQGFEDMLLDISAQIIRAQLTQAIGSALGVSLAGARAAGGPVSAGSTYLVGERGPELFTPSRSGAIVPNHKLGGDSRSVNITVNINNPTDVPGLRRSAGQVIEDAVMQADRRRR